MSRHLWESQINHAFVNKEKYDALTNQEKEECYASELAFGTAGIRGMMGLGPNRLNKFTVQKVAKGISHSLNKGSLIIIGYDTRHLSQAFAEAMTEVFNYNDIQVKLSHSYISTPELSFLVRYYGATMGIMITASHNPPEYNGIKVYGSDGAQLIDAPAKALSENINAVRDVFNIESTPFNECLNQNTQYIHKDALNMYKQTVKEFIGNIPNSHLCVTFSSLHGTSVPIVPKLLDMLNFKNYYLVEDQCEPNGEFPTVKIPNPESPDCFHLSQQVGKKYNADILLATDPDADRLGIAVKQNDTYTLLNGNEIGLLLLYFKLNEQKLNKTPVVISTIVTNDLSKRMIEAHEGHYEEVLTGFKYIGDKVRAFEMNETYEFLFGYEESYGYLLSPFVRDKDGIQTVLYLIKQASKLKNENRTLIDVLHDIYASYGKRQDKLFSHTFEGEIGKQHITNIMDDFRNHTPNELCGMKVIKKEDFYLKESVQQNTGIISPIHLPKSNVIKLHVENGWIALRPSGTEPKIKLYISLSSNDFESLAHKINDSIFSH